MIKCKMGQISFLKIYDYFCVNWLAAVFSPKSSIYTVYILYIYSTVYCTVYVESKAVRTILERILEHELDFKILFYIMGLQSADIGEFLNYLIIIIMPNTCDKHC